MGRLQKLESLVLELRGQLKQKHASGNASEDVVSGVQAQFGRLVVQDASQTRYVSGGFWTRVNDEVGSHFCSLSCPTSASY
jgi:hypothetical protein